jgi:hypothetical protein
MASSTKQSRATANREAARILRRPAGNEAGRELEERVSKDVRREVDRVIDKNGEALRRLADH